MSGIEKARAEMRKFARDIMVMGGNITIDEKIAAGVFSDQFVDLVDIVDPGVKSEITITRDGKILGRVTIER